MSKNIKTYADCYLYNKYPIYNKVLFDAIMSDNFIDKGVDSFNEIIYDVKRTRVNDHIIQVLQSKKTVLLLPDKSLPNTFTTFVAKDPRANKELRLFIDCTNCIIPEKDGYRVNDTRLLSHLISGYYNMKYSVQGDPMMGRDRELAAICWSKLFVYLIDYLAKISVVNGAKDKCIYLSSRYFLEGICKVESGRAREVARKISGITEIKENTYNFMTEKHGFDAFQELRQFTELVKKQFSITKLTTDIVVEKWMFLFGTGTVFALEYLPAFITMMTDAYVGSFINNQKTIEKVCGKTMIEYSKNMIDAI